MGVDVMVTAVQCGHFTKSTIPDQVGHRESRYLYCLPLLFSTNTDNNALRKQA